MKLILIAALAVFTLSAQQAPLESEAQPPTPPTPHVAKTPAAPAKIQDRPLSQLEISDSQLLAKTVLLEQSKIADSQRKIAAAQQKYAELLQKSCSTVGVEKWQSECGFSNGIGQNDEGLLDQNGRPVQAHVWKLPAPPAAAPASNK